MDEKQGRFGIDELADFGGVSRRTVRYYVQEDLLPAPLGVGRGRHYDQSHVDRLLRVKALQEAGRSLDEIRVLLHSPARPSTRLGTTPAGTAAFAIAPESSAPPASPASLTFPKPIPRSAWRRLALAPGVELHVSHDIALPAPGRLAELAAWCAQHLARTSKAED